MPEKRTKTSLPWLLSYSLATVGSQSRCLLPPLESRRYGLVQVDGDAGWRVTGRLVLHSPTRVTAKATEYWCCSSMSEYKIVSTATANEDPSFTPLFDDGTQLCKDRHSVCGPSWSKMDHAVVQRWLRDVVQPVSSS